MQRWRQHAVRQGPRHRQLVDPGPRLGRDESLLPACICAPGLAVSMKCRNIEGSWPLQLRSNEQGGQGDMPGRRDAWAQTTGAADQGLFQAAIWETQYWGRVQHRPGSSVECKECQKGVGKGRDAADRGVRGRTGRLQGLHNPRRYGGASGMTRGHACKLIKRQG